MSSCIVSGCKSGYKTKANEGKKWHMFYPPKNDPELFATWQQLCRPEGQKLSAKHRVCHRHFPDDMLITQITIPLQDGCVYQSKLEYWRLKPGAFPCVFDGCGPGMKAAADGTPAKKRRRRSPLPEPAAEAAEDMCGSLMDTTLEPAPTKSAVATQTEVDWFVVRDSKDPKRPVLQERAKTPNGVFVPFTGLTGRERKYLLSIARKTQARDEGTADHSYHGVSLSLYPHC